MKRLFALTAILSGTLASGAFLAPAASPQAVESTPAASDLACSGLAALTLKDVRIVSATGYAAGADLPDAGLLPMFGRAPMVGKAPAAMCRVVGRISPTPQSDIGFEVWLPAAGWNGRLHGIGVGGFAGIIDYFSLGTAIKGGQAGVATDTGHRGSAQEYGWAVGQPEAVRDYSWRGVHLSTVAAKRLVAAYYGRSPDQSYFVGCSGGGRQGLVEASRFPDDYDGVVAGAPAASFTKMVMSFANTVQAQNPPGAAIRQSQVKLLQEEVLAQCDGSDGQVDQLIADPRQCRFDASKLACGTNSSPQCFSEPQLTALRRIQAGPRNAAGQQLAGGFLPAGSESGDPSPMLGWEGYLLRGPAGKPGGEGLADGMLGALIARPFATPATFDWERHPGLLAAASREIDAPYDLSRFYARGGKLIMWHGWADAAIPPELSLDWFGAMLRRSGRRAQASSRLFMIPGVQHCAGGLGPDVFGQVGAPALTDTPERNIVRALQDWREGQRAAPASLVARRGHGGGYFGPGAPGPERQRLICAWPKQARLRLGGDPDKADSYSCEDGGGPR